MNEDKFLHIKELTLKDYLNNEHIFQLKDKPINFIEIKVISGDEIADVFYQDCEVQRFKSIDSKHKMEFFDGEYIIGTQRDYELFLTRADTYDKKVFY